MVAHGPTRAARRVRPPLNAPLAICVSAGVVSLPLTLVLALVVAREVVVRALAALQIPAQYHRRPTRTAARTSLAGLSLVHAPSLVAAALAMAAVAATATRKSVAVPAAVGSAALASNAIAAIALPLGAVRNTATLSINQMAERLKDVTALQNAPSVSTAPYSLASIQSVFHTPLVAPVIVAVPTRVKTSAIRVTVTAHVHMTAITALAASLCTTRSATAAAVLSLSPYAVAPAPVTRTT